MSRVGLSELIVPTGASLEEAQKAILEQFLAELRGRRSLRDRELGEHYAELAASDRHNQFLTMDTAQLTFYLRHAGRRERLDEAVNVCLMTLRMRTGDELQQRRLAERYLAIADAILDEENFTRELIGTDDDGKQGWPLWGRALFEAKVSLERLLRTQTKVTPE